MRRLALQIAAALALSIALALVAVVAGESTRYLICLVMIWSIFALGFDLAFGVAGLLSFGHAAMFGAAAYAFSLLTLQAGVAFWVAVLAGMATGALLGLLFGVVARRSSGVYLGLVTLALAQLVQIVIETKLKRFSNGTDGIPGVPRPEWAGIDFYDNRPFAVLIAAIFAVVLCGLAVLRSSPFGRSLSAMRQNEVRLGHLGADVALHKLAAFTISGAVAGLAGTLLSAFISYVGPEMLRWTTSGDVLIMTVLGGRGTLFGPIAGVALFEWLRETLSGYTEHWYGLLGIVFIAMTLGLPGGIAGGVTKIWTAARRPGS